MSGEAESQGAPEGTKLPVDAAIENKQPKTVAPERPQIDGRTRPIIPVLTGSTSDQEGGGDKEGSAQGLPQDKEVEQTDETVPMAADEAGGGYRGGPPQPPLDSGSTEPDPEESGQSREETVTKPEDTVTPVLREIAARLAVRRDRKAQGYTVHGKQADVLASRLRWAVTSFKLPPGTVLPGTFDFADALGVSVSDLQKAREKLIAAGILRSKAGYGTYVPGRLYGKEIDPDTLVFPSRRAENVERVMKYIRNMNNLPAGSIIPSNKELSELLELNESSVIRAMAEMGANGEVELFRGTTRFKKSTTEDPRMLEIERLLQYPTPRGKILRAIALGFITPGAQLPSSNELEALIGVPKIDVKRAYADLQKLGFVESRRGKGGGTTLLADFPPSITQDEDEFPADIGLATGLHRAFGGRTIAMSSRQWDIASEQGLLNLSYKTDNQPMVDFGFRYLSGEEGAPGELRNVRRNVIQPRSGITTQALTSLEAALALTARVSGRSTTVTIPGGDSESTARLLQSRGYETIERGDKTYLVKTI